MNASLLLAETKSNVRGATNRRDTVSGRSDAASPSDGFDNVLAGVGDPATSVDPKATTNVQAVAVNTAATASVKVTAGTSLLTLLFNQTPSAADDDDSGRAASSGEDAAASGTSEALPGDPASLALNAAFAALQVVAGANPANTSRSADAAAIESGATVSGPAVATATAKTANTSGNISASDATVSFAEFSASSSDTGDMPPHSATAGISAVKVETHLAGPDVGDGRSQDEADTNAAPTEDAIDAKPADAASRSTTATAASDTAAPAPTTSDPTSFIAPSQTSPIQAVTNAVTKTLETPMTRATADEPATAAPAPPRTMTLQLTPANLGTVSVTMHLVGGSLDLRIAASEKDTLGTISRDRDVLSKAVQDHGYDLRTLVVQGSDTSAGPTGDSNTARDQDGRQTQTGADRQNAQSNPDQQQASGQRQNPGSDSRRQQRKTNDTRAPTAPRAGALFV